MAVKACAMMPRGAYESNWSANFVFWDVACNMGAAVSALTI